MELFSKMISEGQIFYIFYNLKSHLHFLLLISINNFLYRYTYRYIFNYIQKNIVISVEKKALWVESVGYDLDKTTAYISFARQRTKGLLINLLGLS